MKLIPSILAADPLNLQRDLEVLEEAQVEVIHVDIMDGNFVPNIAFGTDVVKNISERTNLKQDLHLMVDHPERIVGKFLVDNIECVTIHFESTHNIYQVLSEIKAAGYKVGLAINPGTAYESIKSILPIVDRVLVMTVNAGAGGQTFIQSMLHKVRKLDLTRQVNEFHYSIEVDGGINDKTLVYCRDAGANDFVAGSFIFNDDQLVKKIEALRAKMSK